MLYLKSLGYGNVKSMNGGTSGWAERGLPVEESATHDDGPPAG